MLASTYCGEPTLATSHLVEATLAAGPDYFPRDQNVCGRDCRHKRAGSRQYASKTPDGLEAFLNTDSEHLAIPAELIRRLSPDFLLVMELKSELDGLIAHLYGLTETEFAHVLSTLPLVPDPVKVAAQNAHRDVERGLVR